MILGKLYINGEFVNSENGNTFDVFNPYSLECIGKQANAQIADIEKAILGVVEAFKSFKKTTAYERADLLRRLFKLMKEHELEIAEIMTLEQGKPLSEAIGEVRYAASYVAWYAEEGIRITGDLLEPSLQGSQLQVHKEPIGAVGIITPWNFPLAMFVRKLAPAIAAGCTVVIKPAEQTPLTAVKFFELIHKANFPKGVCQLITGDPSLIGDSMMSHPGIRKISFTGSTEVGQMLVEKSAKTLKKLSLELGGHAPLIVFEDANLEAAAQGTVDSKFRNCGQVCIATNRVLVHESVLNEYLEKLIPKVSVLTFGDGFSKVDMGPIIDENGFNKIKSHVEDALSKGAILKMGGHGLKANNDSGGFLFEPTVLINVNEEMKVAYEETFGPVLPIITFKAEEDALEIANNTPYGLAAYFFTENLNRSIRVSQSLEYGMIGVNTGKISSAQGPFGGVKMSGFGREGGKYGIEEYLQTKYVSIYHK